MELNIITRRQMNDTELEQVKALEGICNEYEGLTMRLNWGMLIKRTADDVDDFLAYDENGLLIGFLGMYGFGGVESEISGMVHPRYRRMGIFKALLETARTRCPDRGITRLLFICERPSLSGKRYINSTGAKFSHSEYRMELKPDLRRTVETCRIKLRTADWNDAKTLVPMYVLCFEEPVEQAEHFYEISIHQPEEQTFVAELDTVPVGTVKLVNEGKNTLICALGVLPEYRGKGFGREILSLAVESALALESPKVELEVACENEAALSLYKSCGFVETSVYDYYRMFMGE